MLRKLIAINIVLFLLLSGCSSSVNSDLKIDEEQTNILIPDATYDVIIVGSDPEGISAAISAARAGGQVLLIDKREEVGGLFTLGWLNFIDMNYNHKRELVTKGIFQEFYNQLEGTAFSIDTASNALNIMIANEKSIDVKLSANDIEPILESNAVIGIKANIENKTYTYFCNNLIDATQDGDIAALASAPFTLGYEDIGGPKFGMAVTQVFSLKGMTNEGWQRLREYLRKDGDPNSSSTDITAWGFKSFNKIYKPTQEDMELRGPNFARQPDGRIMINALKIFNIDPLEPKSIALAKEKALTELDYIIPFFREHIPGMENIELDSIAPELYIRESRHFITEYRLTIDDVLENRDHEDRIAIGSYPVDIQGTAPGLYSLILGNPKQYAIPLRCLIPLKIDNLMIVGRSAGYDSLAHGSSRMIPVGMCTAEAAGATTIFAQENGITVRDFSKNEELVTQLQSYLISKGAYLPSFSIEDSFLSYKYYDGIKLLRKYALVCSGYNNNYKENRIMQVEEYNWMIDELIKRADFEIVDFKPCIDVKALEIEDIENSLSNNPNLISYLKAKDLFNNLSHKELTLGETSIIIFYIKEFYSQQ